MLKIFLFSKVVPHQQNVSRNNLADLYLRMPGDMYAGDLPIIVTGVTVEYAFLLT